MKRWYYMVGKNKFAFTLAEVLVTLGIIGVVAAITMPTLVANNREKQLITALKKNNALIEQSLYMVQSKYGYTDYAEMFAMNSTQELYNKLAENLKMSKSCGTASNQGCISNNMIGARYRNNGWGSTVSMSNYDQSTSWAKGQLTNGSSIFLHNYVKSGTHNNSAASSTKCGVAWPQCNKDSKGNCVSNKKDADGNYVYGGVGVQCGLIGINVNGPNKGPNQFGIDVYGYVVQPTKLSNWESSTIETMRNDKLYYNKYTPGKYENK